MFKEKGGNFSRIIIASLYLKGDEGKQHFMSGSIKKIKDIMKYANGDKILLSMDANAHSTVWGNKKDDLRGKQLLDFICEDNLNLLNDDSITFIGSRGHSAIDLTLTCQRLRDRICDWKVNHDLHFGSDHLPITFNLRNCSIDVTSFRNPKKIDWDIFDEVFRITPFRDIVNSDQAEIAANELNNAFNNAFEESCPLSYTKNQFIKPWFDTNVNDARAQMRSSWSKYWKLKKRNNFAASMRHYGKYLIFRRQLQKTTFKARTENFVNFCKDIHSIDESARLVNLKKAKGINIGTLTRDDGTRAITNSEIIDELACKHFMNHANEPQLQNRVTVTADEINSSFLADTINSESVRAAIFDFSPYKKAGTDKIYPIMLQKSFDKIYDTLIKLYRFSLASGYIPLKWLNVEAIFIPKPGKDSYETFPFVIYAQNARKNSCYEASS
jgi:Endonuclease-reverse transcriptase